MKKWLLNIGTLGMIAVPTVAVVACGDSDDSPASGVQDGDQITISFEGRLGDDWDAGVPDSAGSAQGDVFLMGDSGLIAGFEDGIRGMEIGDTKQLHLKFPDNHHTAAIAGQNVIYDVTIDNIEPAGTVVVKDGDYVNVGFEARLGTDWDTALNFANGYYRSNNHSFGVGNTHPLNELGFERMLEGVVPGEENFFSFKVPNTLQYSSDVTMPSTLVGQDIIYRVKVFTVRDLSDIELAKGDTAVFSFDGRLGTDWDTGVSFSGGQSDSYELEIGSGGFIDGFEDAMIGMHFGETRILYLKFPPGYSGTDDSGASLADRDVMFKVELFDMY